MDGLNFTLHDLATYCSLSYHLGSLLFGGETYLEFASVTRDPLFIGVYLNTLIVAFLYILARTIYCFVKIVFRLLIKTQQDTDVDSLQAYRGDTPSLLTYPPPPPYFHTL